MKRFAAAVAALIVAIPLLAFMPWSGTTFENEVYTPPLKIHTEKTDTPSPSPILTEEQYKPDAAEVEALARMLYGEARGIPSEMEKAACVWCVLNRVDDPRFPDTVLEVLEAPYQFAGYSPNFPVIPELEALAADVLTRYHEEKQGKADAARILPAEYVYFTGDGRNNHFTKEWKSENAFQWTLTNPYNK